jgi:hypothetical protein
LDGLRHGSLGRRAEPGAGVGAQVPGPPERAGAGRAPEVVEVGAGPVAPQATETPGAVGRRAERAAAPRRGRVGEGPVPVPVPARARMLGAPAKGPAA